MRAESVSGHHMSNA